MEKLWTATEVAKCLGVQEADVDQLVREGQLTGYKLGGQFLRFRPDQVEALKGRLRFRTAAQGPEPQASLWDRTRDFMYFYDFYLVSAGLLAVVAVYLLAAG
jgi:excisionase family DNA binding protein